MNEKKLFESMDGIMDEDLILIGLQRPASHDAGRSRRIVLSGFLRRAASVAAAAVLALFISTATAEAAGVRVVTPFVSWTGSALRLDYSVSPYTDDGLPEITRDPSETPSVSHIGSERFSITSEDELIARFGNSIRLPGKDSGLEFVSAKGSFDELTAVVMTKYFLSGKEIRINIKNNSGMIGTEYGTRVLTISGISRYEEREIGGVICSLAYGAPWNYISIVIENESYLISGEVEMNVLEAIVESMFAKA